MTQSAMFSLLALSTPVVGVIVGVVCAKADNYKKTLYVYDILTTKPGVLKKMMQYFVRNYKGFTIEGMKRGKLKQITKAETIANKL